jgi:enoyl-CoA hydratase
MNITSLFERRSLLKAAAALGGLSALFGRAEVAHADGPSSDGMETPSDQVKMADIPPSSTTEVTVERRGQIVLIGINRPYIQNRIDPKTFLGLAKAYYQYDHDPSLRAAVLFGHGDDFSRGIDVDAFQAAVASDRPRITEPGATDTLARTMPILSRSRWSSLFMVTLGTWATNFTSSPIYE